MLETFAIFCTIIAAFILTVFICFYDQQFDPPPDDG